MSRISATPFEITRERGGRKSRIVRDISRGCLPLRHSFRQGLKNGRFITCQEYSTETFCGKIIAW